MAHSVDRSNGLFGDGGRRPCKRPKTCFRHGARSPSVAAFSHRDAVRADGASVTYAELDARVRRLGCAFAASGIARGDVIATLALNSLETIELHDVAALAVIVLNPINYRLDRDSIAGILRHGRARALVFDPAFADLVAAAVASLTDPPAMIPLGADGYDAMLACGDPAWPGAAIGDERAAIALNYTSGSK